jgi:CheY-like chemotaxis protein
MGNRALLCDDDAVVRSVVRRLVEDLGYEVVGEAETSEEALHALDDLDADLLVLDLALRAGNGEELLARCAGTVGGIRTVVFSAYVGDHERLLDAGATAVVEKPDFVRLEEVARVLLDHGTGRVTERRTLRPRRVNQLPPPTGLTLSGFEPWQSFVTAAAALAAGDAVLGLDVVPDARLQDVWDDVYRLDYRIALARAAAGVRRSLERVSISPSGVPVLLVVGGSVEAPTVLFDRLDQAWRREVASGTPVGAFGHVDEALRPTQLVDQVLAAVAEHDVTRHHALRMV